MGMWVEANVIEVYGSSIAHPAHKIPIGMRGNLRRLLPPCANAPRWSDRDRNIHRRIQICDPMLPVVLKLDFHAIYCLNSFQINHK